MPATIQQRNAAAAVAQRDALLAAFTTVRGAARRRRLRAVLGHARVVLDLAVALRRRQG